MAVIDTGTSSGTMTVTGFPNKAVAFTTVADNTFTTPVTVMATGAGNVVATPAGGGADVTFPVAAGGVIPCRVSGVKTSGTTATGLIALFN